MPSFGGGCCRVWSTFIKSCMPGPPSASVPPNFMRFRPSERGRTLCLSGPCKSFIPPSLHALLRLVLLVPKEILSAIILSLLHVFLKMQDVEASTGLCTGLGLWSSNCIHFQANYSVLCGSNLTLKKYYVCSTLQDCQECSLKKALPSSQSLHYADLHFPLQVWPLALRPGQAASVRTAGRPARDPPWRIQGQDRSESKGSLRDESLQTSALLNCSDSTSGTLQYNCLAQAVKNINSLFSHLQAVTVRQLLPKIYRNFRTDDRHCYVVAPH